MAKIVSGKSRVCEGGNLERGVFVPEVSSIPDKIAGREKREDFFNWCASRGYVSEQLLRDSACGENIFGYLAQRGIFYRDTQFFKKAVSALERRAVELIGEEKFQDYKKALTPRDNLTRQFRVLRAVFESQEDPVDSLLVDIAIWDTYEHCLKEYSPYIKDFGSSTIDMHLDTKEAYLMLALLVRAGEECKEDL